MHFRGNAGLEKPKAEGPKEPTGNQEKQELGLVQ